MACKQVVVAFTMPQAEALLAALKLTTMETMLPYLIDAIDAIESTIVNEHGEE